MLYKNDIFSGTIPEINYDDFSGNIPDDFMFDITNIPGSSDDITLQAIEHYKKQAGNPNLEMHLRYIAHAYVTNLTDYYEMCNFNSPTLRKALPHFSENVRFMESKNSPDIHIESSGRIKSLYSFYDRLADMIQKCISKNEPIPEHGAFYDIYATRDIFIPFHDMTYNPQQFYKLTYRNILEYFEFIDKLNKQDSRYSLIPMSENEKQDLKRPKIPTYSDNDVDIPSKNFIEYALEERNIPVGYKYLAEISDDLPPLYIVDEILMFKNYNLDDKTSYSASPLYKAIVKQTEQEMLDKLKYIIEKKIIESFPKDKKDILKEFRSLPISEFLIKYQSSLNSYQSGYCKVLDYLDNASLDNIFSSPEFNNKEISSELKRYFL